MRTVADRASPTAAAPSAADWPQPRTPGRARLATASLALADAATALDAVHQRASRLAALIEEAVRRESEAVALRAADDARLGGWLAAESSAPRPEPDPATGEAESRCALATKNAAAARAALPAAEREFESRAAAVRALQRQRDQAVCAAAVEAAQTGAERFRAALVAALRHEAALRGLRDELLARGNGPDAPVEALAAAADIGALIAAARRGAAVDPDPVAGRALIAALVTDPDAEL